MLVSEMMGLRSSMWAIIHTYVSLWDCANLCENSMADAVAVRM